MADKLLDWLRLREPIDAASRSETLTNKIASTSANNQTLHVLDLATGTGSNLRYLASRLQCKQHWLAIDKNQELLENLPQLTASLASDHHFDVNTKANQWIINSAQLECHIETQCMDLNSLDIAKIFEGQNLVTASALLDLVSEQWLRTIAERSRSVEAAALFAITYTGRSSCLPQEPEDELVRSLLNQHQLNDKGLGGPAAGPAAVECAAQCFIEAGYHVQTEPSDWVLGNKEKELQRQLVESWAEAAIEMSPRDTSIIRDWLAKRLCHINDGHSCIVVGHLDLAAWLPQEKIRSFHEPL
jgi:hypothetical protein